MTPELVNFIYVLIPCLAVGAFVFYGIRKANKRKKIIKKKFR